MAVAMVMPHCNILLQLSRLPMLTALPSWEKRQRREGREEETRGETRVEGSAAGSTRMLIILSRQSMSFIMQETMPKTIREDINVYVNTQAYVQKHIHAWVSAYTSTCAYAACDIHTRSLHERTNTEQQIQKQTIHTHTRTHTRLHASAHVRALTLQHVSVVQGLIWWQPAACPAAETSTPLTNAQLLTSHKMDLIACCSQTSPSAFSGRFWSSHTYSRSE